MSRYRPVIIAVLVMMVGLIAPSSLSASGTCSAEGYTVVFVNGIFTTEFEADESRKSLETAFRHVQNPEPTKFRLGYNPSHLGGGGDLIQSVSQAFHDPISTFDLDTILMQIHPEVTTRKILLVGHSQGSFYTNEMYSYLVEHGVPKESIGVYQIATPAVFVAGGGSYVTSINDKVINRVRGTEIDANLGLRRESYGVIGSVVASALRANITVPPEQGYNENRNGGHAFQVYMNGAGERIVADIQGALSRLRAGAIDNEVDCFTPPQKDIGHQMKAAAYAVADPLSGALKSSVLVVWSDLKESTKSIAQTRGMGLNLFNSNPYPAPNSATASQLAAPVLALSDSGTEDAGNTAPKAPELILSTESIPAEPAAPIQESQGESPGRPQPMVEVPIIPNIPQLFAIPPGSGGGGGGSMASQGNTSAAPVATVAFSVASPVSGAYVSAQPVTFTGTSDPLATVYADAGSATSTTTADASGAWNLDLALPEGSATVSLYASSGGNDSAVTNLALAIDRTAPATTTPTVSECAFSLVTSSCIIPYSDVSLDWTTVADADSYGIAVDGVVIGTTTSLATNISLASDATSTITIVTYDITGNSATSSEVSVRTLSRSLIINEVGWAGALSGVFDPVHVSDQWIEIKNISSLDLTLGDIALQANGASLAPLSGSLPAGSILVFEQTEVPFTGLYKIVSAFPSLSSAAADQISLVWNGITIDATPASGTCAGWCAGSDIVPIGTNTSGVTGLYTPLSMERVSDDANGLLAASWQDTDSYAPAFNGTGKYWGTPGNENSTNLPESGVYCDSASNLVAANASFDFGSGGCTYLMKFISGGVAGVSRYAGMYRGTVASSTQVTGHSSGKSLALSVSEAIPADAAVGEDFFFAMFENRTFGSDVTDFNSYFTTGAPLPPHGNYVTIPWILSP